MSLAMCFMLLAACLTVNASKLQRNIDNDTIQNVFGTPNEPPNFQVKPLRPQDGTSTFVDIDANPEDYYKAPVKNYDAFDWTLTKRVSSYTPDNFLLSPLGLKLPLAILAEAATGKTRDELAAVLGFDKDLEVVRAKFSDIVQSLQLPPIHEEPKINLQHEEPKIILQHEEPKLSWMQKIKLKLQQGTSAVYKWADRYFGDNTPNTAPAAIGSSTPAAANSSHYILNLGSRVYIDESAEPQQRFAAIAEKNYQTELSRVDFTNANTAAAEISAWVAKLTKGKITELVKPEDISNQIMMIINALYFKGTWRHQFDANDTKTETFYVTPTQKKPVLFMNVQAKFHYVESTYLDSKILRMPFLGNKFSMYVVVPNSLSGLPRVMDNLGNLRAEMYHLDQHIVDLRLPKFDFDTSAHLDGVLKELGIREAFTDDGSFPGIARGTQLQKKLKISRVLQKAGIEVNEVGSTAYAATEISLVNKFGVDADSVQEVIANKPFLFFIEDEKTRQLLFTGRLTDPTQKISTFKYAGSA